ncbi:MAG: hypothetical protein ACLRZH_15145 [Ruthenibacterium lactatiformans]
MASARGELEITTLNEMYLKKAIWAQLGPRLAGHRHDGHLWTRRIL